MKAVVTWTEEVRHQSTIGLNIDNVEAAGLDPTSPDDVLEYVRRHMDPLSFREQIPGDYSDVLSTGHAWFASVDEIDVKSGIEATA